MSARRPTLSVFCRTATGGPRAAAILGTLRETADEIVVAVDGRADPSGHADVAAVADRLIVYPYADPVDRVLPWLFAQCLGDWAFAIDDDEIPSLELIEALPELLGDLDVVHVSFQVRWLFPDAATYLDEWPWQPHYAARLLRTDPRLIRFSNEVHRSIVTSGPGRFLPLPLWHADTVLRPFDERRRKADRYEHARPGMRIAGRALNQAFYVPELKADARLAPVPDRERGHVESVLHAGAQHGAARAVVEHAAREEIDLLWPVTAPEAQVGGLELLDRPTVLVAGEARAVDVRVRNTGTATWPWGAEAVPEIRVSSRWYDAAGRQLPELEIHTLLPADVRPGGHEVVPVHVRAPEAPGQYRVEIALIQTHVGRIGGSVGCEIDVEPQRRIAVVADDETIGRLATVLGEVPEVELVRLRRAPSPAPLGYREAPDLRSYLFDGTPTSRLAFSVTLLWRTLQLRFGSPPPRLAQLFATLREAELLVIAAPEGPDQRRERWALRVLARLAERLGCAVVDASERADLVQVLERKAAPTSRGAARAGRPSVPR